MTVEQQEIYLAKQRQVRICCLMETGRFKTTQEIRSKFNFHSGCVIFLNKMEYKTLCWLKTRTKFNCIRESKKNQLEDLGSQILKVFHMQTNADSSKE